MARMGDGDLERAREDLSEALKLEPGGRRSPSLPAAPRTAAPAVVGSNFLFGVILTEGGAAFSPPPPLPALRRRFVPVVDGCTHSLRLPPPHRPPPCILVTAVGALAGNKDIRSSFETLKVHLHEALLSLSDERALY